MATLEGSCCGDAKRERASAVVMRMAADTAIQAQELEKAVSGRLSAYVIPAPESISGKDAPDVHFPVYFDELRGNLRGIQRALASIHETLIRSEI